MKIRILFSNEKYKMIDYVFCKWETLSFTKLIFYVNLFQPLKIDNYFYGYNLKDFLN